MSSEITINTADYRQWLGELKTRYRQVQLKAAVSVNTALLQFYWELGADMVAKQIQFAWGSGFLTQLSSDLGKEFPGAAGFSKRNLEQIRRWHTLWNQYPIIAQQAASQLMSIPWWHHVVILSKCKQHDEALYYVQATQTHGWSRSVLTHQIESGLWQREGKAITNFAQTLPAVQSDLAVQMLKDPYKFDFLSLTPEHTVVELETALIEHVTQFLLELGGLGYEF
jgi:predicted nuclease of restriction endonuclease-like (RecB) superfamily